MSESCCGRSALPIAGAPAIAGRTVAAGLLTVAAAAAAARFRYRGDTAMTVWGRVTGRRYHFGSGGAELAIDPRDAPSLRGIPGLEPVGR